VAPDGEDPEDVDPEVEDPEDVDPEDVDPEVEDPEDVDPEEEEPETDENSCTSEQAFDTTLCACVSLNQCENLCADGLYKDPIGGCECLEVNAFIALYNHGLDENCGVVGGGSPIILNFYGPIYGDVSGISGDHNTIVGSVPIGEEAEGEEADEEEAEGEEADGEADGEEEGEGDDEADDEADPEDEAEPEN